jgi:hypothetical protein
MACATRPRFLGPSNSENCKSRQANRVEQTDELPLRRPSAPRLSRRTLIKLTMNDKSTSKDHLGVLFHPANLLKTIASQVPIASALVEARNQIAGYEFGKRIDTLETGILLNAKIQAMEISNPSLPAPLHDWSLPVGEFMGRTVDLSIAYDSGFHPDQQTGKELILPIAHGCIVGDHELLVCKESLQLMEETAQQRKGRCVVLAGRAWHEFEPGEADSTTGLSVCRLNAKDEARWQQVEELWKNLGLGEIDEILPKELVKYSAASLMGQEVGFIHAGEAEDVMCGSLAFSARQFDSTTISHFRKPRPDALKTFVTGVLSGRILRIGSPVFTRCGDLLGVISDTENYPSDAGRRAVVRSLLGHPRFTKSIDSK